VLPALAVGDSATEQVGALTGFNPWLVFLGVGLLAHRVTPCLFFTHLLLFIFFSGTGI
jgi:hypothetical protein